MKLEKLLKHLKQTGQILNYKIINKDTYSVQFRKAITHIKIDLKGEIR